MMELLDSLSDPGHAAKPNEDAHGVAPAHGWVIDGATGVGDGPLLDAPSDAAWLAQTASAYFRDHADRHGAGLDRLLHEAIDHLARRFDADALRPVNGRYELPSAAMALVHWDGAVLHCANYADCEIAVLTDDGQFHHFGGVHHDRQAAARQRTAALMARLEPGQNPLEAPEIRRFLQAARNRQNRPDGYWILGLDTEAVPHMRRWQLPLSQPAHVLLMSDGFAALHADYGRISVPDMVTTAVKEGLVPLLQSLRHVEHVEDKEGRIYPRFKASDDATALLLRIVPKSSG
ncbi:MAG: hypothetical protein GC184_12415 [Rhizobiales bacterium]|nr:hypothetical protein [Hyphomicrobiales bacterium]